MLDHFRTFAAYNRWANLRLYEAAGTMSEEDFHRDCSVAFHSMHGTLNHILVGDAIWLARFQQSPPPPHKLDTILAETLDELGELRSQADSRIIQFVDGLDMDQINAAFTYAPVTLPEPVTLQLGPALAHLFNHQTHHRGQAHAILTRLTGKAPPLDLIYFQLENRSAKSA
ncbi:MAG: DinB family protein [Rhizobiaceae bacterium]